MQISAIGLRFGNKVKPSTWRERGIPRLPYYSRISPDEAENAYARIPFLRNGGSIVVSDSPPGYYAEAIRQGL